MLSCQYAPLFSSSNEWGRSNIEQKNEFGSEMNRFTTNIDAALESMSCGIELSSPKGGLSQILGPEEAKDIFQGIEEEPGLIGDMETLLEEWCEDIERYLSEPINSNGNTQVDSRAKKSALPFDKGPKGELDFWRARMQRLNSITENLRSERCKKVVAVLSTSPKGSGGDRSKTKAPALLQRWKQIDISVTEAANESKDNIKYLSSLQRFVGPLYGGTVGAMTDSLPALLNSVKVSNHRTRLQYIFYVPFTDTSLLHYTDDSYNCSVL